MGRLVTAGRRHMRPNITPWAATLALGPIATVTRGGTAVGDHMGVTSDAAAIGGGLTAIGISTIILWRARRSKFPSTPIRIHRPRHRLRDMPSRRRHHRLLPPRRKYGRGRHRGQHTRRHTRRRADWESRWRGCRGHHRRSDRRGHRRTSRAAERLLFVSGRLLLPLPDRRVRRHRPRLLQLNRPRFKRPHRRAEEEPIRL